MQPNRPASSSGGRGESRVRSSPQWVVRASRPPASLHSRRLGPAKWGGLRATSARRAGSAAVLPGTEANLQPIVRSVRCPPRRAVARPPP